MESSLMGFILLPALSESRMLKYISKYYYIIFCRYLSDSPETKRWIVFLSLCLGVSCLHSSIAGRVGVRTSWMLSTLLASPFFFLGVNNTTMSALVIPIFPHTNYSHWQNDPGIMSVSFIISKDQATSLNYKVKLFI